MKDEMKICLVKLLQIYNQLEKSYINIKTNKQAQVHNKQFYNTLTSIKQVLILSGRIEVEQMSIFEINYYVLLYWAGNKTFWLF